MQLHIFLSLFSLAWIGICVYASVCWSHVSIWCIIVVICEEELINWDSYSTEYTLSVSSWTVCIKWTWKKNQGISSTDAVFPYYLFALLFVVKHNILVFSRFLLKLYIFVLFLSIFVQTARSVFLGHIEETRKRSVIVCKLMSPNPAKRYTNNHSNCIWN